MTRTRKGTYRQGRRPTRPRRGKPTCPAVALFLAYRDALERMEEARLASLEAGSDEPMPDDADEDWAPTGWDEFVAYSEAIREFESARFALECELRRHLPGRMFETAGVRFGLVVEDMQEHLIVEEIP